MGARVIASASSPEKLRVAAEHGADVCIDYSVDGFRDTVLAHTGGRGADVIFDPVGGKTFDESLRCIAPYGRIIPMGRSEEHRVGKGWGRQCRSRGSPDH